MCRYASVKFIVIAQSLFLAKFMTLFKVSLLKCCVRRYLLRGFKFFTGLSPPVFDGTMKNVLEKPVPLSAFCTGSIDLFSNNLSISSNKICKFFAFACVCFIPMGGEIS